MKTRIAKWMITRSEITGGPVPSWVHRWLPGEERKTIEQEEATLTRMLRAESEESESMPDDLRGQLDKRLAMEARLAPEEPQLLFRPAAGYALAALALAAAGLFVVQLNSPPPVEGPQATIAEAGSTTPAADASSGEGGRLDPEMIEEDVLLRPLAAEKERLASDMGGALRFMANSFLPPYMVERIDKNLDNLEQDFARGM